MPKCCVATFDGLKIHVVAVLYEFLHPILFLCASECPKHEFYINLYIAFLDDSSRLHTTSPQWLFVGAMSGPLTFLSA